MKCKSRCTWFVCLLFMTGVIHCLYMKSTDPKRIIKKLKGVLLTAVLAGAVCPSEIRAYDEESGNIPEDYRNMIEDDHKHTYEEDVQIDMLDPDGEFHPEDHIISYIERHGGISEDGQYFFLYDLSEGAEILLVYEPDSGIVKMLTGKRENTPDGDTVTEACTVSWKTGTEDTGEAQCLWKETESHTYITADFDRTIYRKGDRVRFLDESGEPADPVRISELNDLLADTLEILDRYIYSVSEETLVLSLDELGFAYSGNPDIKKIQDCVEHLYRECLDREADREGYVYWVRQLYNGDTSVKDVLQFFVTCQEFRQRNLNTHDFVLILYRVFLDRTPKLKEYCEWVLALRTGMSRYDAVTGFAESEEFAKRQDKVIPE